MQENNSIASDRSVLFSNEINQDNQGYNPQNSD